VLLVEHVVVVQLLPAVADEAVQLDTATFVVLLFAHVVCFQSFAAVSATGVHELTGVGPEMSWEQVIVAQPLTADPVWGVQV